MTEVVQSTGEHVFSGQDDGFGVVATDMVLVLLQESGQVIYCCIVITCVCMYVCLCVCEMF